MLIYHPAFDASHCSYRIVRLFNLINNDDYLEEERIKIMDFYTVFPKKIKNIKFPQQIKSKEIRKELDQINDIYRPCRNPYLIAKKMSLIQEKVLQILVINEYLDYKESTNSYKKGQKFNQLSISNQMFENQIKQAIEILIIDFLLNHPLNGKDGLKDRTSLMEFRYDN